MIPEQNSEKPRHTRILHAIIEIEHMVQDLAKRKETPALDFNGAVFQMTGAVFQMTDAIQLNDTVAATISARNVAQQYHMDMSDLLKDKSAYPDHRRHMLDKLEAAADHLKNAQQNLAHDIEGKSLSKVFLKAVENCDIAISKATRLIKDTVLESRCRIQSQQSQSNIINEIREHRPTPEKPAPRPDWMKLVVSNPSSDLH